MSPCDSFRGSATLTALPASCSPASCLLPPAFCPRDSGPTRSCQMSPLPTFFRLAHPDGPVLVRVAPRSSTKSRPLDLELRATDDVRAFVLPCKYLLPSILCRCRWPAPIWPGGPHPRLHLALHAGRHHPAASPHVPPRPASAARAMACSCNYRCGHHPASLGGTV
jgi:hypothetical protein